MSNDIDVAMRARVVALVRAYLGLGIAVAGFIIVVVLWLISPFILVWAINTLFHTSYAITTFLEWLAGLLLVGTSTRSCSCRRT